jgi:hypothetical protein
MVRLGFLFILHAFLLLSPQVVSGQATPEADACSIAPLRPDQLQEVVAEGFEPPQTLDDGEPNVPAEALVKIFAVVTESVECANANDPLRSLALFTDRYLAERFAGEDGADELGHLLAAATRTPVPAAPEDQLVLLGVGQPVRYADGRIGVLVTTANADSTFTDLLVFAEVDFAEVDEEWRIDQVVIDAGSDATPAASGLEHWQRVG